MSDDRNDELPAVPPHIVLLGPAAVAHYLAQKMKREKHTRISRLFSDKQRAILQSLELGSDVTEEELAADLGALCQVLTYLALVRCGSRAKARDFLSELLDRMLDVTVPVFESAERAFREEDARKAAERAARPFYRPKS